MKAYGDRTRIRPTPKASVTGAASVGVIMTPEQIAAPGSEHAHQCALFQWVAITGRLLYADLDLLHAIPNGGDREAHVGSSMKAEGVKKGVPDLHHPVPAGPFASLWIEMKKPGRERERDGGLSKEQKIWCTRLIGLRHCVCVCYSWYAAAATIERYYRGSDLRSFDGVSPVPVDDQRLALWGALDQWRP